MRAPADRVARLRSLQPAVVAFIEDRITDARARRVTFELVDQLLADWARWAPPAATLGVVQLSRAEAEAADPADPVHGWKSALPIALPDRQRRRVSSVMNAIVRALDKSDALSQESAVPLRRSWSGRRIAS